MALVEGVSVSSQLNRLIRNAKRTNLLVTPRLDKFLIQHGANAFIWSDETFAAMKKALIESTNQDRSARFGASSRGTCERAQVFGFLGGQLGWSPTHGADSVLQQIFLDGQFRHLRWQMTLLQAGIITQVEYKFSLPAYRLDGANIPGLWGFELKGTGQFPQACNAPFESHLLQVHTYFLGCPELELFSLVYEDKHRNEWKEYVIERDQDTLDEVQYELDSLNASIETQELPDVLPVCKGGDSATFKKCPYSNHCLDQTAWPQEGSTTIVPVQRKRRRKLPIHQQPVT
jgi:hypothetical protein